MTTRLVEITLKVAAGISLLATAYAAGAGLIPLGFHLPTANEARAAEKINTPIIEANLVESHKIEYVEEKVVEVEYVDVVREVPQKLRNFATLDELKEWLEIEGRMATLRFSREDLILDCDDYASEMQQEALEDGYIVSFEIIGIKEYNLLFSVALPETQSLHAINLAIIGNGAYYIEPQTCEVVQAAYLD